MAILPNSDSSSTRPELELDAQSGLRVVPLWIDGKPATASPSKRFAVRSAEQQKDVFLAETADKDTAIRAVDAAWRSFKTWKKVPGSTRRDILLRFVQILKTREEELVAAQIEETSCSELWARKNVSLAADLLEEVASHVTSIAGSIPQTASADSLGLVFNEPLGVVLSIAPWNSSVILGSRSIATPIAAGCTVVFKASELCPRTHGLLVEIFEQAGLPAGVLNVIQTSRDNAVEVTEALIAHPGIRKVEFIGSAPVGREIGKVAAQYLKPILMELGGKGPAIVLDDANLEEAASSCIAGAFLHHGQLCFSTERIIVHQNVATQFTELLKAVAATFPCGSAVSARIAESSKQMLVDAQSKGAKFLIGGPVIEGEARLVPTIITNVTKDMAIFDREGFGPSVSLYIARDDAHAVDISNDSAYGLNAAIFSQNMERALNVARELDIAQVHINNMTVHDEPTFPIGGVKGSGWGRNNARWGLDEFLTTKLITVSMAGKLKFL